MHYKKLFLQNGIYRVPVRQQILPYSEEVLPELPQTLNETFRLLFAPLFVDALRHRTLDERLQRSAWIVARVMQLQKNFH